MYSQDDHNQEGNLMSSVPSKQSQLKMEGFVSQDSEKQRDKTAIFFAETKNSKELMGTISKNSSI